MVGHKCCSCTQPRLNQPNGHCNFGQTKSSLMRRLRGLGKSQDHSFASRHLPTLKQCAYWQAIGYSDALAAQVQCPPEMGHECITAGVAYLKLSQLITQDCCPRIQRCDCPHGIYCTSPTILAAQSSSRPPMALRATL